MKIPYLQLVLILSLSFLTLFTSCTEEKKDPVPEPVPVVTEPEIIPTEPYFYKTEAELNNAIDSIYVLTNNAATYIYVLSAYSGADDLSTIDGGNKAGLREADQFNRTVSNDRIYGELDKFNDAIIGCNKVIENTKTLDAIDETITNNVIANARFIRAFFLFKATTIIGDMPMPLTSETVENPEVVKSRLIMDQVIADLEFANQWLINDRDTNPTAKNAHASKTAAKAYLAKVYMQLTGWPYNETAHWAKVKEYTSAIIDAGVYSLMDVYSDNFEDPTQNNAETIFAHEFVFTSWAEYTYSRYYGSFWTIWLDFYMEHNFYKEFPEGYRKTYTASYTAASLNRNGTSRYNTYDHPVLHKFLYGTLADKPEFIDDWHSPNDVVAMRYAEVLLMNAEACANTGDNASAIEYLNMVKRRAYANGLIKKDDVKKLTPNFWKVEDVKTDYSSTTLTSKEAIVDAIVKERSCEFVGEIGGNYWLDLIRLEKVGEANAKRDAREIPLIGNPSDKTQWYFPLKTVKQ